MHIYWASGWGERDRCTGGVPIDARGVGWLDVLLRRVRRLRVLQWVLLFAGAFSACPVRSETITLAGDDSDPNIAGYRIYYGTESRAYEFRIDAGRATSCSVSNLIPGNSYFFAATAYSHLGLESDFSPEIAYTPGLGVASIFADEHGTVLSWASEPGAVYRVLATPTLTDPVWEDVSGALVAPSRTRLWLHRRTTRAPCTFYRIEAVSGTDRTASTFGFIPGAADSPGLDQAATGIAK